MIAIPSITIAVCLFAAARAVPPEQARPAPALLAQAIHSLSDEARHSLQARNLKRAAPNFAADFAHSIPASLIDQKLSRPQHGDPFIDAYIRWQLTSFPGVKLEALNDRAFEKMLADLPKPIENPRADRALIDDLSKAASAGRLDEAQQAAFTQRIAELEEHAGRVADLNVPALALRTWVARQLPKSGSAARRLLGGLEHVAALIETGWPADEAKSLLDRDFAAAAHDRTFTMQQRKAVMEKARSLVGPRRLVIASAGARNGVVWAEYIDTAVYDFDVRRWDNALRSE